MRRGVSRSTASTRVSARATSIPRSASTAAPASRYARSRRSARTDGCRRPTSRSSTTTWTFFIEVLPGRDEPLGTPGGASQGGRPRHRHPASSTVGGGHARRPLLIDAHVHVPVLGPSKPAWVAMGPRLRTERHPRGPLGRRRVAAARSGSTTSSTSRGSTSRCCCASTAPGHRRSSASRTCCRSSSSNPGGSGRSPTSTPTCTSRSPTR